MYGTFTHILNPALNGSGYKWGRRYSFGHVQERSTFDGAAEEFDNLFLAKPPLNGSSYMRDTVENRNDYHNLYARRHGFYEDQGAKAPAEHVLTAKEATRLDTLLFEHAARADQHDGTLMMDFEQDTNWISYGPLVSSMQTQGKLAKVNHDGTVELLAPKEYLFVQGEWMQCEWFDIASIISWDLEAQILYTFIFLM